MTCPLHHNYELWVLLFNSLCSEILDMDFFHRPGNSVGFYNWKNYCTLLLEGFLQFFNSLPSIFLFLFIFFRHPIRPISGFLDWSFMFLIYFLWGEGQGRSLFFSFSDILNFIFITIKLLQSYLQSKRTYFCYPLYFSLLFLDAISFVIFMRMIINLFLFLFPPKLSVFLLKLIFLFFFFFYPSGFIHIFNNLWLNFYKEEEWIGLIF